MKKKVKIVGQGDCPCERSGETEHRPNCLYYSPPKAKHTPGPWTYAPQDPKAFSGINAWGKCFQVTSVRANEVQSEYIAFTLEEANAALIAAGPETAAERDRLKEINGELREQVMSRDVRIRDLIRDETAMRIKYVACARIINALSDWSEVGNMPSNGSLMPDSETETFGDAIRACAIRIEGTR